MKSKKLLLALSLVSATALAGGNLSYNNVTASSLLANNAAKSPNKNQSYSNNLPVSAKSGFYLGAGIEYQRQSFMLERDVYPEQTFPETTSNNGNYTFLLGYNFYQKLQIPVRVELDGSLSPVQNYLLAYENGTFHYNLSNRFYTLIPHVYLDWHNATPITPYAGVGIGWVHHVVGMATTHSGSGYYPPLDNYTNSNNTLGWDVTLGFNYEASPSFQVGPYVRYADYGDQKYNQPLSTGVNVDLNNNHPLTSLGFGLQVNYYPFAPKDPEANLNTNKQGSKGYFMSGSLAYSHISSELANATSLQGNPVLNTDYKSNSTALEGMLGYDLFTKTHLPIRVALAMSYLPQQQYFIDRYQHSTTSPSYQFLMSGWTAMGDAFLDLHNSTKCLPYIGGGAGLSLLDTVTRTQLDARSAAFSSNSEFTTVGENAQTQFAWMAQIGVDYLATSNLAVGPFFRYESLGKASFKQVTAKDSPTRHSIVQTANSTQTLKDYQVGLALRYTF